MELSAIASVSPNHVPCRIAVIGSGPLPLTALCVHAYLSKTRPGAVACHNIDRCAEAIECSTRVCRRLGYSAEDISFENADADRNVIDLESFDVVYLAALVGDSGQHKLKILANVVARMRPGALVVMRSAHSLRKLLYTV